LSKTFCSFRCFRCKAIYMISGAEDMKRAIAAKPNGLELRFAANSTPKNREFALCVINDLHKKLGDMVKVWYESHLRRACSSRPRPPTP